jgi:hypothetical protein
MVTMLPAQSFHEQAVIARRDPQVCEVAVLGGYPYDCDAARRRPNDLVMECRTHRCWWVVNPETGQDRTLEREP